MVEHGAYINKENNKWYTPLYIASQMGHETIVKYLVNHHVDINKTTDDETTSLFRVVQKRYEPI